MEKLSKLKVEKFRILKDSELKRIVGRGGGCEGTTNCGGSCSGTFVPNEYQPDMEIVQYYPLGEIHYGTCYYSSIARQCVCG